MSIDIASAPNANTKKPDQTRHHSLWIKAFLLLIVINKKKINALYRGCYFSIKKKRVGG